MKLPAAQFKYSKDGGSTWTGPKTIKCDARMETISEPVKDAAEAYWYNQRLRPTLISRRLLVFEISPKNFLSNTNTAASPNDYLSLFKFVDELRNANLIHFYDGGVTIGKVSFARNTWNAIGNTAYLVPHDTPAIEWQGTSEADKDPIPVINFALVTRDMVTLA